MIPRPSQVKMAFEATEILMKNGLVYLACEERTGKTLTSILVAEGPKKVKKVLVITKPEPLKGWDETFREFKHTKKYTVTCYTRLHTLEDKDFDLIILDEAHNYISAFPKRTPTWKAVRILTKGKPIIYLSATPDAQGYHLLFNQLALSNWSPWRIYKTPLNWFRAFGIPKKTYTATGTIPDYTNIKPEAFELVKHLFITKTRKELGFEKEPEDLLHYIKLDDLTVKVYNLLMKHRVIKLNGVELKCDTITKLRFALHMIEGGVYIISRIEKVDLTEEQRLNEMIKYLKSKMNHKCKNVISEATKTFNTLTKAKRISDYYVAGNTEKIDYIKSKWGDNSDTVIMYNYKAEKTKLESHFSNAIILQATSFAEGVDLSSYKHLIIYSQDWSTARHVQRRARQANMRRTEDIIIHFLLVKDGISDKVYETVAINKKNYVDSLFKKTLIK